MRQSRTRSLIRAALVSALLAAGALIALPLGPVPVTLQVLVAAVAVLVLTPAEAVAAFALYAVLGAAGAPVFAGGNAGIGVLAGPTGGFIVGFVVGAPLAALARRHGSVTRRGVFAADLVALGILLATVYATGWAWFAVVTRAQVGAAFGLVVAPFLLIDAVKCAAALAVARGVRAAGVAAA